MVPDQGLLLQVTGCGGRGRALPPAARASVEAVAPLVVRGLTVAYGNVRAVDALDLDVDEGRVIGLVGPNGSGKTTTLRAVLGLVPATGGRVTVEGFPAGTIAARAHTAWIPDEPSGLDELTVAEYLDLVRALWRADEGFGPRADVLARVFALDARLRSPLGSLSHGQRRLVAVVAAVALARRLLLLDEATAALDPEAVIVLREVLRGIARRGTGVVLATQDLHFAEAVCDTVTLLSAGRVAAHGRLDELRARYGAASLEDVFVAALGAAERLTELRSALDAL
jgi:ABC-type multidrug transport system ATPase subunit